MKKNMGGKDAFVCFRNIFFLSLSFFLLFYIWGENEKNKKKHKKWVKLNLCGRKKKKKGCLMHLYIYIYIYIKIWYMRIHKLNLKNSFLFIYRERKLKNKPKGDIQIRINNKMSLVSKSLKNVKRKRENKKNEYGVSKPLFVFCAYFI